MKAHRSLRSEAIDTIENQVLDSVDQNIRDQVEKDMDMPAPENNGAVRITVRNNMQDISDARG